MSSTNCTKMNIQRLMVNYVIPFTLLFLSITFAPSNLKAQNFVSIKMYPEHVGVFTTKGQQQFVAFGVTADGKYTNITRNVDWTSSNKNLVTIDANGKAQIVNGVTAGQVKITCSYPKKKQNIAPVGAIHLLLGTYTQDYTYLMSVYFLLLK